MIFLLYIILKFVLFYSQKTHLYMRNTLLILFTLLTLGAHAQKVLSPNEYLPHRLGEQFTAHHQLVDYYEYLAKNKTEQMRLSHFGKTNEERDQLLIFVSSKENIANLEQIRTNNLIRCGLAQGKIVEKEPIAIVWLGYSVHGNEPAGSECSMQVAYDLLTKENLQDWLKNTVVIIDPSQNPDGYDRYTHWYRDVCNRDADIKLQSREHQEPWPGGRVNHYLFDLNRDWAWATQVETQNRLRKYHEWMPHVHPDIHEQGWDEPYYFAPAAQPYHKYITPWQRDFQVTIGKNNAKYFDANGWLYFTREVFDLFYPSYGDTYPTFNGAIGMTYEQGGIGAGRAVIGESGDTLTLFDRVLHHYTTSLSTIEVASKNAGELTKNFSNYFKNAQTSPQGEYKTYVIKNTNSNKIKELCKFLDTHKIQYGTAIGNVKAYDYAQQTEHNIMIEQRDLVISAFQPMSVLTQILFDPKSDLVDSLTYDITAWTLPYAYGLEAYATKSKIDVRQGYGLPVYKSDLGNGAAPYAYVARWNSVSNAKYLAHLLRANVRVRFSTTAFEIEGKKFDAGSLILTRADNRRLANGFDNQVKTLAFEFEQDLTAVSTGFVDKGHDFGSSAVRYLAAPRVLLVGGEDVNNTAFGHLWYYFEQDLNYPSTILASNRLKRADLSQYDVIVLPDGDYDFDSGLQDKIRDWVSAGGRLIVLEEAIKAFEDVKGFGIAKSENKDVNHRLDTYSDRERINISEQIPGAIFKLNIDNTNPLAYGLPNYYYTLKTNTLHFPYLKDGENVGRVEQTSNVVGFAGYKAKESMKESLVFGVNNLGKGAIIYMSDSPVFRGFWQNGKLLMSNAVFFVGQKSN